MHIFDKNWMIKLFLFLAVLQVLDLATTFIAIKYTGAVETNPYLAEFSLSKNLIAGSLIKICGMAALSLVFFIPQYNKLFERGVKIVYLCIYGLCGFYLNIFFNNLAVIKNGIV